ncbi:PilZ domain-containing protein [Candidatus Formimonas warabiya]|uniref:PilZ domain-containing protein n=1 Tax=Formimonas warabiya TaxID=1761012 RepID=A0A3G1KYF8_FORW1|nr:PilZ domain-containing protein [Candidatus Formimonas warabiya]ATW27481.1 hypothetical protein DCMF_24440 [Candidatus Formimonas warabiya]
MEERRKSPRLPAKLELTISSLFKQNQNLIGDLNENIQVINISKAGIGFTCGHELPLDYYFDAKIQLTEEKFFFAVLKIIRIDKEGDGYLVGCEFVGLSDTMSRLVEQYAGALEEN